MFDFDAELEKLDIKDGDILLLKTKTIISERAHSILKDSLGKIMKDRGFKDIKVLILEEGITLEKQ